MTAQTLDAAFAPPSRPANPTDAASDTASHDTASHDVAITPADLRRAAWTCSLGSALEYYDFALYSLASALVFGPLFFPSNSPGVALIASFATYSIGFAVRPVGGIVFGALGDKYGRKRVLLLTVTLMGIASTAIGLLPTYQSVGIWAPILLISMRVLQGLGAGAEQAGAAVMMTEYAPTGRRGFYAAMPFLGIQIGTIIAALVYCALLFGGRDVVVSWVWRVPFLLSALILCVAIYMRLTLKESPAFAAMEEEREQEERPGLIGLIRQSWKTIIIGIGLRAGENGGSSLYQVLAISYIVHTMGLPAFSGTIALISAALVGGVTVPVAGLMSDRFGRVKTYRTFAILEFVSALPVWWAFSQGSTVLAAMGLAMGLGVSAWGMFGSQAAFLPEMFGARHRYIGVSLTREVSAVIAGDITPLVGSFIIAMVIRIWPSHAGGAHPGSFAWVPLALYVMALALTTIIATFFIPECRNRNLLETNDLIQ